MIRIQPIAPDEASSRWWWKSIVDQVAGDNPSALEILYRSLCQLRFEIVSKVGQDRADDIYHDTIVALIDAIRSGRIRTPEALPAFARTIIERKGWLFMKEAMLARATVDANWIAVPDGSLNPEQLRMLIQKREIAERILGSLPACQREVLTRFYLKQEPAEEIRRSMQLSATQFRLIKSRAKASFGERGRAYLASTGRVPSRSDASVR